MSNKEKFINKIIDSSSGEEYSIQPLMLEGTYLELKSLRDQGKLIPGAMYRMTDYVTSVDQEFCTSAYHPFDLILTALTPNSFSEDAKACRHEGDTYFAKVEYKWNQGVTLNNIVCSYKIDEDELYLDKTGQKVIKNRTFTEISYKIDVNGKLVPALHEYDPYTESKIQDENWQDICDDWFLYSGTFEVDGVVYDKWDLYRNNSYDSEGNYNPDSFDPTNIQDWGGMLSNRVVHEEITDNLNAWKIKYCIDNDKDRFAWADKTKVQVITNVDQGLEDNRLYRWPEKDRAYFIIQDDFTFQDYQSHFSFAWGTKEEIEAGQAVYPPDPEEPYCFMARYYSGYNTLGTYTNQLYDFYAAWHEEDVSILEAEFEEQTEEKGKGVIYYLEDEKGNKAGYDFKNIMFLCFTSYYDENLGIIPDIWYKSTEISLPIVSRESLITDSEEHVSYFYSFTTSLQVPSGFDDAVLSKKAIIDFSLNDACFNNEIGLRQIEHTLYLPQVVLSDFGEWSNFTIDQKRAHGMYNNKINNNCYYIVLNGLNLNSYKDTSIYNLIINENCHNILRHTIISEGDHLSIGRNSHDIYLIPVNDSEYTGHTHNLVFGESVSNIYWKLDGVQNLFVENCFKSTNNSYVTLNNLNNCKVAFGNRALNASYNDLINQEI